MIITGSLGKQFRTSAVASSIIGGGGGGSYSYIRVLRY